MYTLTALKAKFNGLISLLTVTQHQAT